MSNINFLKKEVQRLNAQYQKARQIARLYDESNPYGIGARPARAAEYAAEQALNEARIRLYEALEG